MPPILLRLLALGLITWVGAKLLGTGEEDELISEESDCDDLFKKFNSKIEISPEKVEKLKRAHYTIRDKIIGYIDQKTNLPRPRFFIQGSYKTKTLVENTSLTSDVDLGVFFPYNPGVYVEAIQKHLKRALEGHTRYGVTIKSTCVRVNYVSGFHVDLPIYYIDSRSNRTFYGARGYEWEESDPKGFIRWYKSKTSKNQQLHRVVRYLKSWLENVKHKSGRRLPSGLAATLWAIEFYESNERDDISFVQTCLSILDYLNQNKKNWRAQMPVAPFDDVINRLSRSQKDFFYQELQSLCEIGMEALTSSDKYEAQKKWRSIFGKLF